MPLFDDVLGLVQPPTDPNDYTIISVMPIVKAPEDLLINQLESDLLAILPQDLGEHTLESDQIDLPDNSDHDIIDPFDILYSPSGDPLDPREIFTVLSPPTDSTDTTIADQLILAPLTTSIDPLDGTTLVSPPPEPIDPLDANRFIFAPPDLNTDIPDLSGIITSPLDSLVGSFSDDIGGLLEGGFIPAPSGVNWGNTIIDQIFTGANNILDFLGIPFPESLNEIYQFTQTIEGFIEDPRMLLGQVKEMALGFLFPRGMENMWDEAKGLISSPPDAQYEAISGSYSNIDCMDFSILGEEVVNEDRLADIVADISESQFAFQGRKSVVGMTMRLNHLWDLKVEPYLHHGRSYVPYMGRADSSFYMKVNNKGEVKNEGHLNRGNTETYRDREKKPDATVPDYEDTMPVLSYDLDFKSLSNKDIELFGGSSISIPEIVRKASHLSIQVMDDENKRWRRWFQRYIEAMYDEVNNVVKPYKACCVKITLYQYRTDLLVLSHKVFLAVLKNYQVLSSGSGSGSGNADIIDAEWSIVGEMRVNKKDSELNIV